MLHTTTSFNIACRRVLISIFRILWNLKVLCGDRIELAKIEFIIKELLIFEIVAQDVHRISIK